MGVKGAEPFSTGDLEKEPLVITLNSRETMLYGQRVILQHPIISHDGGWAIAEARRDALATRLAAGILRYQEGNHRPGRGLDSAGIILSNPGLRSFLADLLDGSRTLQLKRLRELMKVQGGAVMRAQRNSGLLLQVTAEVSRLRARVGGLMRKAPLRISVPYFP